MKLVLLFLSLILTAAAQNTTVSATIIGPDKTPWAGADIKVSPGQNQRGQQYEFFTDQNGSFSKTIPSNWYVFNVCSSNLIYNVPGALTKCFNLLVQVSGVSMDLSLALSGMAPVLTVAAPPMTLPSDPVQPLQAATKNYVDNRVGAVWVDPRDYGAIPVYAPTNRGCHQLPSDLSGPTNQAVQAAFTQGPPRVYFAPGYCWPMGKSVRTYPGVEIFSVGRAFGDQVSSPTGAVVTANATWAANNTAIPYTALFIQSADSTQSSVPFLAKNVLFGSNLHNLTLDCDDQPNCSGIIRIGGQEHTTQDHNVIKGLTASGGGFAYGFLDLGVDCNGRTAPDSGCLINRDPSLPVGANPFSAQDGPDTDNEYFGSDHIPADNHVIPVALMGVVSYTGLGQSTINPRGTVPYGIYAWGSHFVLGPQKIHTEGVTTGGVYIGNIPAGTSCTGGDNFAVFNSDSPTTIAEPCASQVNAQIHNSSPVLISGNTYLQPDFCFSAGSPTVLGDCGLLNSDSITNTNLTFMDPGEFRKNGHNAYNYYVGNSHAGLNGGTVFDAGLLFVRGYHCSNLWWNPSVGVTPGFFSTSAATQSDYACLGFLNGGGLGFSSSTSVSANQQFSGSIWINNIKAAITTEGHFLGGAGWIDPTSMQPTGYGPEDFQGKTGMAAPYFKFAGGPSFIHGTGAPVATTYPYGTEYTRDDTGNKYVYQNTGWVLIK